jgi:hypothetical protein
MINFLTKEILKDIVEVTELPKTKHITEKPNPESYNKDKPGWEFNDYMENLIQYCADNGMKINPLPHVEVINNDSNNANKILGLTGHYNPTSKEITLFTLNRHPKDILRTLAHELVHHEQNLENRLHSISTTNTNEDSKLSAVEDEAYLKGNRIFRHWEDNLKK